MTMTSIRASVATIPARPAAAMVTPFAGDEGWPPGAEATSCGSACPPATAARTCGHELQCALPLTEAATPAGAAAISTPATMAAPFRRSTPSWSHTRLRRTRPRPVSIKRSRSNVVPQSTVSARQAVIGSSSEGSAKGDLNTKRASGRSATAAETGDSRKDHAPPAAPSRGNSMKPSILPIAAQ